jgi:hypothetical protein
MRKHLSYANLAASAALFLALAGGTTAIALGTGSKASKPRPKPAGVMTSRITGFEADASQCGAVSGISSATVGCSAAADPPWQISPATRLTATGLAVRLTDPSSDPGASRTFSLVVDPFNVTALSCTVDPGETTCKNQHKVEIPAGSQLLIHQQAGNGAVVNTDAMVAFRLTKP